MARNVSITRVGGAGTDDSTNGTFTGGVFIPNADNAVADIDRIETDLNAGTNVVVNTNDVTGAQQGDITVTASETITTSGTGTRTLRLNAEDDIFVGAGANITQGGTGALNIVLNANSDASGAGRVLIGAVGTTTTVTTNGGDVSIGGGDTPLAGPVGGAATYATSGVSGAPGVQIDQTTLNSGGGNIAIAGSGFAGGTGSNCGVIVEAGSNLNAAGGDIDITGVGTVGQSDNYGVAIGGGGAPQFVQTVGAGTIEITGTGGSGGSGANDGVLTYDTTFRTIDGAITIVGIGGTAGTLNDGMRFGFNTQIVSLGSGAITLTGTGNGGGAGIAANSQTGNFGPGGTVRIGQGVTGTYSGNISLNSLGGSNIDLGGALDVGFGPGTTNVGTTGTVTMNAAGAGVIKLASGSAIAGTTSVTLTAGNIALAGTVTSNGTVKLKPSTTDATIGVNDPTKNFSISDAEIDLINAPGLIIGSATNTGGIMVALVGAVTAGSKNLELLTGGPLVVDLTTGISTSGTLTLSAETMDLKGGTISGSSVTLRTTNSGTSIGVQDNSQTLSLTDAELDTITTAGGVTIGSATNTGGITVGTDGAVTAGAKNLTLVTGTTIAVNGAVSTTGSVALNAGTSITQTAAGVITASGLAATATAGSLDLTRALVASSNVTTFAANASGSVGLLESDGFSIGSVGGLNGIAASSNVQLKAGGTISQTQAITAGGLAVRTSVGDISLTSVTNSTKDVAFNTAGNASYKTSTDINVTTVAAVGTLASLSGATVGGTLALTTTGAATTITQTGGSEIHAANLGLLAGGNVTLTENRNAVENLSARITGTGNFTYSDNSAGSAINIVNLPAVNATTSTGIQTANGAITMQAALVTLDADLRSNGSGGAASAITIVGATVLTSAGITIDTDSVVDFRPAGNVTLLNTVTSDTVGSRNLTVDASSGQAGVAGGQIFFGGVLGGAGTDALGVLTVLGNGVTFTGTNNVGTLAVALSGAGNGVSYTDADALTVGTVGGINGIMTNGGAVTLTAASITLNAAVSTTGAVALNATGGVSSSAGGTISAGSITVNAGGSGTLNGSISGGSFTKEGAGTVTLAGTNTYSGTTTINAGTLRVWGGLAIPDLTGFPTGAVVLANVAGATLELINTETIGSLAGGGAAGGNVDLVANTLTTGGAGSTSYAGSISGTGGLTKAGISTFTLTGANGYLGATTINGGTLLVNGSVASSATTVKDTGTLGGTGSVGAVNVASGGTLAPGASAGTLTTGSVTLNGGANVVIEIGGSGHDQIKVVTAADTVALNNATLTLVALSGFNPESGTFVIIDNAGSDAITTTFAGLAEGAVVSAAAGNSYRISYAGGDGNDVVLTALSVAPIAVNDTGSVTEDVTLTATGNVLGNDTDPDSGETHRVTLVTGFGSTSANATTFTVVGQYGVVTVTKATGAYTYKLSNSQANVQALVDGQVVPDVFTYENTDSSGATDEATLTISVMGTNDAPTLTTMTAAVDTVAEDTQVEITFAEIAAQGDEGDVDGTVTGFVVKALASGTLRIGTSAAAATAFAAGVNDTIDATHHAYWTAAQHANGLLGAFTVVAKDNGGVESATPVSVQVNVTPVNDAPVVTGSVTLAAIGEDSGARLITQGQLLANASDVDGPPLAAANLTIATGLGSLTNNGNGTWSYTPAPNDDSAVTFSYQVTDGIASPVGASATLDITPVNDAPVVSGPVTLAAIDEDSGARLITQGQLLANASDVDGPPLAAANLTIATGLGSLTNNGNGTWSYIPAPNDDSAVTFSYQVTDGTTPVAASATLDINPVPDAPPIQAGTAGDDTFDAPSGASHFAADGGIDTMRFGFRLVDAEVTYDGNKVIIDGSSSQTVLNGFERFVFTDGTVDNNDGNWLIDDLFYYSTYHDVWNAHVDADAHYDANGWHEWRDPSAFFSTSFYLAVNQDVKAAGVNPLAQWHSAGWSEGRLPSFTFDARQYLADNPDVAAAHVDPLEHFLHYGAQEGREPTAPTGLIAANGFDYIYYLKNNPDVLAAHIDPLEHFNTHGWHEGRNPNALFDTSGYLATYADVAAAGVNPLDHYHLYGWTEGRDPSVDFDTGTYLATYSDVAAAHIDPLRHFLQDGIHEGRSPFGDSMWG
jgi:VCBS repeat-containing protein